MGITRNNEERLRTFLESEKPFLEVLEKIDVDDGLNRFIKETGDERRFGLRALSTWRPFAVAASFALLVAIGFTMYFIILRPDVKPLQLSAGDHNATLEMVDGSAIFLKEGSLLEYPQKFRRKTREVRLTGEAYFEIMHNKATPFVVHVGNHEVKVLGTSFNVRQAKEKITVSVIEGKVSLSGEGEEENEVVLLAGEKGTVIIRGDVYQKQNITSNNFLYWKTGKLSYSKVELGDVFNEIGSCFGVVFAVDDPEILRYKLTTTFDDLGLDEILDELDFLFDLQFVTKADSISISKKMQ